jgi:hypothetical protein
LGILSLINAEISNRIRAFAGKTGIKFTYKSKEILQFNNSKLPKEVKNRINYWVEDIIDSTTIDYSEVQIKKIFNLLRQDDQLIIEYINKILTFFLNDINILISKNEAS